ncbi:MAG: 5-methyltetrahydropteroyltriglutamate--homocysteine S-methyltransferase [Alphaproteobacteria bacterium]|nr:MAG: 5-methyltetrahydropteroyltriglutamate--homocysteine S-methyltransferase [Alphaproteobacteria bacterium]
MALAANLGFPRVGAARELKKAVEAYWKGALSSTALLDTAKELRMRHMNLQKNAGVDIIPSGDFTLYDHVLDTIAMVGAVPTRYGAVAGDVSLDTYFAMARGSQKDGTDVVAMEMTKWFDTNYHYIVPEFRKGMKFTLSSRKVIADFVEAKEAGITARPVILGPVSFLLLGKCYGEDGLDALSFLPDLLPVYESVLQELHAQGASWVQIDEPCLVLDLSDAAKEAYKTAYARLSTVGCSLMLTTYFGALKDNLALATSLPVEGLHIDVVRAPEQMDDVLAHANGKVISLGIVDGRNIWKTDLSKALNRLEHAAERYSADKIIIAPSCSLLHSPIDLALETDMDAELKSWLAFATQKLDEIVLLRDALHGNKHVIAFSNNEAAIADRQVSIRIHDKAVQARMAKLSAKDTERHSAFDDRIEKQRTALNLPLLPTTTIGSFPQTQEIRAMRAKFKKGEITEQAYDAFLEQATTDVIRWQEEIDIDVPVHGEFERNDMVEYFGEQLNGYAFTQHGWVQSYGSRCVKPPFIYGDVSRKNPMTVRWSAFAQSLTKRPVKGMLTGPVTMLQWSFVRDDQPRSTTCKQIALAVRDEVVDLEQAGITIIQIDEPALREGLPLRHADWKDYLTWAVESFRISAAGVQDETQIHTHMCYSEFNDIIHSIADLDADVISIETSRSAMELLDAFVDFKYPNEIGPGVYDIHSPRVPSQSEMEHLLQKALDVLKPEQIWVNPDCGLKTRGWAEVRPALEAMVAAAKAQRQQIEKSQAA